MSLEKRYVPDYDHVFGGWGVVESKSNLFVAHTGSETGARVKARKLNEQEMYVCMFSGQGIYETLTEKEIQHSAWIWDEVVTRLVALDNGNLFVIWNSEEKAWTVYA